MIRFPTTGQCDEIPFYTNSFTRACTFTFPQCTIVPPAYRNFLFPISPYFTREADIIILQSIRLPLFYFAKNSEAWITCDCVTISQYCLWLCLFHQIISQTNWLIEPSMDWAWFMLKHDLCPTYLVPEISRCLNWSEISFRHLEFLGALLVRDYKSSFRVRFNLTIIWSPIVIVIPSDSTASFKEYLISGGSFPWFLCAEREKTPMGDIPQHPNVICNWEILLTQGWGVSLKIFSVRQPVVL